MALRFHIEPRDVPPQHAARRLGLTEAQFKEKLPELLRRGFPSADPTTGNYDLDAVDAWRRGRHAVLFLDPQQAKPAHVALDRIRARAAGNG